MAERNFDLPVQCCRCKNKHNESDRRDVPSKTFKNATESVCPRCGAKSYFDLSSFFAYCWQSGLIEFGDVVPDGAIQIASGPKCYLKARVEVVARHGIGASERKLLVPGIPESETPREALKALDKWLEWCAKQNGKKSQHGVEFLVSKPAEMEG